MQAGTTPWMRSNEYREREGSTEKYNVIWRYERACICCALAACVAVDGRRLSSSSENGYIPGASFLTRVCCPSLAEAQVRMPCILYRMQVTSFEYCNITLEWSRVSRTGLSCWRPLTQLQVACLGAYVWDEWRDDSPRTLQYCTVVLVWHLLPLRCAPACSSLFCKDSTVRHAIAHFLPHATMVIKVDPALGSIWELHKAMILFQFPGESMSVKFYFLESYWLNGDQDQVISSFYWK